MRVLRELRDKGLYEKALLVVSGLPQAVRTQAPIRFREARLLYLLGRYDEAMTLLSELPASPQCEDLLRKCVEEYSGFLEALGHHEMAVDIHGAMVGRVPDDVTAIINQGISYAMADDYDRALACFNRAIEMAPENEKALYNKGVALVDLRRLDDAVRCFDKVIHLNRSNALAWHQKAVCLRLMAEGMAMPWSRSAKLEEARQCLGKALRIDPNLREARELLDKISGGS